MADNRREALITGIGIVSCLGEGVESHWQALSSAQPRADTTTFAPYVVHPIAPLDYDKQIPKKGDQRQMEPWQRIGTYAAGLALDSAGVKGNTELLEKNEIIVITKIDLISEKQLKEKINLLRSMNATVLGVSIHDEKSLKVLRNTLNAI